MGSSSAPAPGALQLPGPWEGWSRIAVKARHFGTCHNVAATKTLFRVPQNKEELHISLKKRLPKYDARPGWGCSSHRQSSSAGPGKERRVSLKPPSQPLSSLWTSGEQTLAPPGICLAQSQGVMSVCISTHRFYLSLFFQFSFPSQCGSQI